MELFLFHVSGCVTSLLGVMLQYSFNAFFASSVSEIFTAFLAICFFPHMRKVADVGQQKVLILWVTEGNEKKGSAF